MDDRLQQLLDRAEIEDCLRRYTRGIDRMDAELARSAFHPDALDDHTLFVGGGHDFIDWANGVHEQIFDSWIHYITNVSIQIDDDTAHAESYMMLAARLKGTDRMQFAGGRYIDRLERREGRWAIAVRIASTEWGTSGEVVDLNFDEQPHSARDTTDLSYLRPLTFDPEARAAKAGSESPLMSGQ